MSPLNPLRAADMRERNEKIVLRLIHAAGPQGLSQSEAVLATGLRAPTIFRIFSSLEEEGYIKPRPELRDEAEPRERKGRPRVSYSVKPQALYSLGLEFQVDRISLGLFDFAGKRVSSAEEHLPQGADADYATSRIAELVGGLLRKSPPGKLLGLGIGAPGQVNVKAREIAFYSRIPGMKDYPIALRLEEALGVPVSVHNNCSVTALSEFRYGGLAEAGTLFMFLLRSGVNGSFIDRGRITLSSDGTTIETGHISIAFEGGLCACGARGCLESYIAALDRPNLAAGNWLFEGYAEALKNGEPSAARTLSQAALYLSSAARTVSRLYRPRAFLFVACDEAVAGALADGVEKLLSSSASGFDRPFPAFAARAYDSSLAQRGAADLVVDAFLG